MEKQRFYICEHCLNLVSKINDSGVDLVCCGEKMKELTPNTQEASFEKHIPKVEVEGNLVKVQIGEIAHPMTEEHSIEWVYIKTANGGQRKNLRGLEKPEAEFLVKDDKLIRVYAYCNLHGLWMYECDKSC